MNMLIGQSILGADYTNLTCTIDSINNVEGINYIHLDIMDGNFVPEISIGSPVVKAIRKLSKNHFMLI